MQDTAESILKEYLERSDGHDCSPMFHDELVTRARALFEPQSNGPNHYPDGGFAHVPIAIETAGGLGWARGWARVSWLEAVFTDLDIYTGCFPEDWGSFLAYEV